MTAPGPTLRFGVLGTAKIAIEKVLPALLKTDKIEVVAIASRDAARARDISHEFSIPKFYGSYEGLISDENVDAVYIPLPNHLHVEWTKLAARSGKHVLCEKPISIDSAGVAELQVVAEECGVVIQEAFMIRTHPMWIKVKELIESGKIGTLRAANAFFSYFNVDAGNIRNQSATGGGALLDIGCYPVNVSRWLFGSEPVRVSALLDFDPRFGTDVLSTAVMDFGGRHSSFTCSTQLVQYQRVDLIGTEKRLELLIPFNIPRSDQAKIKIYDGDRFESGFEEISFGPSDQYVTMCEDFRDHVAFGERPAMTLEDSLNNAIVLETIAKAGKSGKWESVESVASAA